MAKRVSVVFTRLGEIVFYQRLSVDGAPLRRPTPGAGTPAGPDAASARDLAAKTGFSEGRIKQARKRVKELGTDVLEKVQGTTLATPGELDDLAKLPKDKRKAIVEEAVAEATKPEGERKEVSASREMRAQRKVEFAGTSDEQRKEAGEEAEAAVETYSDGIYTVVQICLSAGQRLKAPPHISRKRARELLSDIDEARTALNASHRDLRAVVDDEGF